MPLNNRTTSTIKTILLDRDGVLNTDRFDYVYTPDQLAPIPEALRALRLLKQARYRIIVITNQACIGRGLITEDQLTAIHQQLISLVEAAGSAIDDIFYCPHHPDDGCNCRKPLPGLIDQAHSKWSFERSETWLVGDSLRDIQAGNQAGCKTAMVRTGHGMEHCKKVTDTPVYDDLLDFVQNALGLS
ncbi:MAG: D-glycero-beta-D-manno-heptose 1,7-bisphosphate 7-phosphatase [Magnetococcales bacterium]|nr:D-glycero-beta-D-manno-heptose 1,7-bisphosphate 7-phosphatase [Magnetococcales bacterium]